MSTSRPSGDWRRTHTCGELSAANIGETVTLNGWVHARRDLGGLYFVDLRDRYGITQLLVGEHIADAVRLSAEDVVSVRGKVIARESPNPERATGEIEIEVEHLEILSKSKVPPFEVSGGDLPSIETRLRHRYVDLRREPMQRNILHRSRFTSAIRRALEDRGFADIETPILTKATPEGARDYLVPSRVHPGCFYALPQSPQIFKQILMVAGFDRYYQIAKCFRDEDLRADRQPDFTQLDVEMCFVEEEDVFDVFEGILSEAFREVLGVELAVPFPRIPWREAMERFGVDKPDTRFGMELRDVGSWAAESEFQVFRKVVEGGGRVKGISVPGGAEMSRKQIDALGAFALEFGAKGLAWWKADAGGGSGPLARFCDGERAGALMELMGAESGDLCLFVAASEDVVHRALGELRVKLGRERGLVTEGWNFLWVTRFPMFDWDEDAGRWTSSHHPFTAPADWDLGGATGPDDPSLGELESRAYDLVLNGWELGSGSIRIHRQDVQERIFEVLGIGEEERREKFGFLLEALSYGAPPHGGFAIGIDRIVALTLGLDNIRDVIAFPKTTSAQDLMCKAPSPVRPEQLADVHIQLTERAERALASGAEEGAETSAPTDAEASERS
ncbi:MAG TPA: aspartate--tRNA ligase [Planctomycetes bacterium]|nr:aspartate--tRNA ligase [Planctomycetota bacterium]